MAFAEATVVWTPARRNSSPALGAEIQRTAAAEPRRAPREAAAAKCIVLTLGDAWSAAHAKDIPRGEGALRRRCRARSLLAGRDGPRLYALAIHMLLRHRCEETRLVDARIKKL